MTADDIKRVSPALDRLQEAHFFLHGLEDYYHLADPFRWHLNAFLRALKEIPQLTAMGLQNREGFPEWFTSRRKALAEDPVVKLLTDRRDFVVHKGMLLPSSSGTIGITEGRGMKLGQRFAIDPLMDSDDAMRRYVEIAADRGDFLGILFDDEESLPCVQRRWSLDEFGGADLVDLCASAWLANATLLRDVLQLLGGPAFAPSLDCRHNLDRLRLRVYDRHVLAAGRVEGRPFR